MLNCMLDTEICIVTIKTSRKKFATHSFPITASSVSAR
jgi:hypothetical protein